MKRRFRLTRSTDFLRVRRYGKSYAHPLIVLVAAPNPGCPSLVGVSASRSIGGAVQRNRSKRLLREAMRPLLPRLLPGWHVLLLARRPILDNPLPTISLALIQLVHKAGILNDDDGI